ncbi:MAG TPA: hypothetical protein VJM46_02610 [Candidatus Saccharimonadales bacterium]|nr:hypothetical protein [Candidatus Saccharimonadales bacterium]
MTELLIPEDRIRELISDVAGLDKLVDAPLVVVSAGMYPDPTGTDKSRYAAARQFAESSGLTGVAHIFMLDDKSHHDVAPTLSGLGGIVVPVRNATEGGLARPYMTAARLIDQINPGALMVKVEAEKDLSDCVGNAKGLLEAAAEFDVITGVRDWHTQESMPHYLRLTEAILAAAIRDLTGTFDAASGVLALTARGRQIFLRNTDPKWQYLIKTPLAARLAGLRVGEVDVRFDYHPDVVLEENGNPDVDSKRRDQFDLMLECAIEAVGGEDSLNGHQLQTVASARSALAALHGLAA